MKAPIIEERLIVFGGVSHNGFLYNTIEEYPITISGDLEEPKKIAKKLSY